MTNEEKWAIEHEFQFDKWKRNKEVLAADPLNNFKLGQFVDAINVNNVLLPDLKILGFTPDGKIYLNWDCYWYAQSREQIISK